MAKNYCLDSRRGNKRIVSYVTVSATPKPNKKASQNAQVIKFPFLSGYENFVSQLDIEESTEKLGWLGSHDYGSLKMKVASSIVAISSIHLLKIFMNVQTTDNDKLLWYVLIHLTLVVSALLMGYLDKISRYHTVT